jgi:hypothetical protein
LESHPRVDHPPLVAGHISDFPNQENPHGVVLPMQQSVASEDLFPSIIGTSQTTQNGQMQLSGSSICSSDETVQLLDDTNLPTVLTQSPI